MYHVVNALADLLVLSSRVIFNRNDARRKVIHRSADIDVGLYVRF